MTITESLISLNTFPVPANAIEKICVDRELTGTDTYTKATGETQNYELAMADTYLWLYDSPNIAEQQVSISQLAEVKSTLLKRANQIYAKYEDPKFRGAKFGYVGENFND